MDLVVQKRDKFGKATRLLRRHGLIPAELYGHGLENRHLNVSLKDFNKAFKVAGESTMIELRLDNERLPVMIHNISFHPISDEVLSVDFYQVRLDELIKVKVPLNFIGDAPAVKEKGGVLVKAIQELEVEALPSNLPHNLQVELSSIVEIGGSIHVQDIKVPQGVKILVNLETVVATVTEKAAEEVVTAVPEVTVESVKVETEEKKLERQAKKAVSGEAGSTPLEKDVNQTKSEKAKS